MEIDPEQLRQILGQLTQEERENLRQGQYWETALTSWLDTARPSVIRDWLGEPREAFLRHLDSKAWDLFRAVEIAEENEIDALQRIFPMWDSWEILGEDADQDEEIEKDAPFELTPEERFQLKDELLPD